MSITDSQYGERWFEFDRGISKQLEREAALKQYNSLLEDGKIDGGQTFEQWFELGNFDGEGYDW